MMPPYNKFVGHQRMPSPRLSPLQTAKPRKLDSTETAVGGKCCRGVKQSLLPFSFPSSPRSKTLLLRPRLPSAALRREPKKAVAVSPCPLLGGSTWAHGESEPRRREGGQAMVARQAPAVAGEVGQVAALSLLPAGLAGQAARRAAARRPRRRGLPRCVRPRSPHPRLLPRLLLLLLRLPTLTGLHVSFPLVLLTSTGFDQFLGCCWMVWHVLPFGELEL